MVSSSQTDRPSSAVSIQSTQEELPPPGQQKNTVFSLPVRVWGTIFNLHLTSQSDYLFIYFQMYPVVLNMITALAKIIKGRGYVQIPSRLT